MLDTATQVLVGRFELPLLAHGNIWIEDSIENRDSIGLTQMIIQQALARTHPGQLEVIVFDEGLSGLGAPFARLNNGGEQLLQTIFDTQDLTETLTFLRQHVQGVNGVIQGLEKNLFDYRARVNFAVENFKLVVISTDVSILNEETQNSLSTLLKAGPPAGVSFLIHSMTLGVNPFLVSRCLTLSVQNGGIYLGPDFLDDFRAPSAQDLIGQAERVARTLARTAVTPIAFESVQPLTAPWTKSSAEGITFSLGRFGEDVIEATLGDELNQRHNVLITGAVGQGKSNAISVMLHSLCHRYSPAELHLYLLDFKEGVTLQPFFNAETGEFLPHARVLGLEADREFGLNVFRHLFEVYRERMATFKAAGVQSLQQYRQQTPHIAMPRILLVIDEFQMMFAERDRISDEIGDLLVKGVRLFRAAGIHIVLASQTIGGNLTLMGSAGEGLFGQVPIRIALKNSLSESFATLGPNNSAAAHLRARQAIVNLDYGNPSSNKKSTIAFADESVLAPARTHWWQLSGPDALPPYVFEGQRRRSLAEDRQRLRDLAASATPTALLGMRIEVHGRPLEIPLPRDLGRHIAIVGSGRGATLVSSAGASLAVQVRGARFVVLDGLDGGPDEYAGLAQVVSASGNSFVHVPKDRVASTVQDLHDGIVATGQASDQPVFVLGYALDRCRGLPMEFQSLCQDGAALGVHILGWWTKLELFRNQVGFGGESFFDTKVALRLDAQSAKQFLGDPLLEWAAQDNRALVVDTVALDRPVRIVPYSLPDFPVLTH
ncbi:FtsK/SpoIIIE domain-containing protein [Granulicoccus sp. GXG6511]|uniref:FtsK/SpoIIIE domain-containing protein n=1 Tax=Granulicoccus sp. GXG6511 TaxID=3381351 RepID=UPI003D7EB8BC